MKKIAIALLALLLFAALLCGCGKSDEPEDKTVDRFMQVSCEWEKPGSNFYVFVDTETGVEYIYSYDCGICPLIDSNGDPYLFPGFDAREDRP